MFKTFVTAGDKSCFKLFSISCMVSGILTSFFNTPASRAKQFVNKQTPIVKLVKTMFFS